eukprot:366577-Chlamydomonas_euryale.AAC.19
MGAFMPAFKPALGVQRAGEGHAWDSPGPTMHSTTMHSTTMHCTTMHAQPCMHNHALHNHACTCVGACILYTIPVTLAFQARQLPQCMPPIHNHCKEHHEVSLGPRINSTARLPVAH